MLQFKFRHMGLTNPENTFIVKGINQMENLIIKGNWENNVFEIAKDGYFTLKLIKGRTYNMQVYFFDKVLLDAVWDD